MHASSAPPTVERDDDGSIIVRLHPRSARAVDIAEATGRWLADRVLGAHVRRDGGEVVWVTHALDLPDAVADALTWLARTLDVAGDEGFATLGAWTANIVGVESLLATARAPAPAAPASPFEAVGAAVPAATPTVPAAPVSAPSMPPLPVAPAPTAASPFEAVGAPIAAALDMPAAGAPGTYQLDLTSFGASPERTIALLATVLRTTPEALAPALDVLPARLGTAMNARDVRRVMVAVATPTGATFAWSAEPA